MNHNKAIDYMERTRLYYRAQGYDRDYQWAHFESVPFTRPARSPGESKLALITTAAPAWSEGREDRKVEALPVEPVPDVLHTGHLSWDKDNTHTRDVATFLPVEQVRRLVEAKIVGSLGPRFLCVPTEYSKRTTMETDAPRILELCRQDRVDIALLVPL